ncbi:hypothetical protein L6452_00761 [Arctium lappa]|uniref:Uncharacterized protein n=1 Tax=Arctium lappa TaxID=4217 RepID=A0ACB9FER4_ARCLA|nr:hypothetical protein L6452_00761 [Arctium lappa]
MSERIMITTTHVHTCPQFAPSFCLILSENSITHATVTPPHSRRFPSLPTPFPSSTFETRNLPSIYYSPPTFHLHKPPVSSTSTILPTIIDSQRFLQ